MTNSEKFWNRMARNYDRMESMDEPARVVTLEKLAGYLKPDDAVLDFACGTGLMAHEIAGQVGKIVGIDTSEKMIQAAEAKAEELGVRNVEYIQADAFDERLSPGSFDKILLSYVLHILDDRERVVRRLAELLKPGGVMISLTPFVGDNADASTRILRRVLGVASAIGVVPKMKPATVADFRALMTDAGLEISEGFYLPGRGQQYFAAARKS